MVGGDDERAAFLPHGAIDARQAGVHRFDGADGRLQFSGMAYHVGIGEVYHQAVE